MNEENQIYFIDSDQLPPAALERKHRLENDPSSRTDIMAYLPGQQVLESDIKARVIAAMDAYQPEAYTDADVRRALASDRCTVTDFQALLSPAAAPNWRRSGISATPSIFSRRSTSPTTARITASIAASTATTTSAA